MPTAAPGVGGGQTLSSLSPAPLTSCRTPHRPNQRVGAPEHTGGSPSVLGGLWGPRVHWRWAVGGAGGQRADSEDGTKVTRLEADQVSPDPGVGAG